MALQGHKAKVSVSGTELSTTAEATSTSDNITYQITDSAKRIMSFNSEPVVKDSGVATTENYRLERVDGKIIFETADAGRVITVDYDYFTMNDLLEANEFSVTLTNELQDITPFLSDGWLVKQYGLKSGSGTLSDFDTIDTYFFDELVLSKPVIIELYPDKTGQPIRLIGFITSDEISAAVNDPQTASIGFDSSEAIKIS